MDKTAQAYYERNSKYAIDLETLTDATKDSVVELCNLYSRMQKTLADVDNPKSSGQYVNMLKIYNQMARYFGLCPWRSPNTEYKQPEEFGIEEWK